MKLHWSRWQPTKDYFWLTKMGMCEECGSTRCPHAKDLEKPCRRVGKESAGH